MGPRQRLYNKFVAFVREQPADRPIVNKVGVLASWEGCAVGIFARREGLDTDEVVKLISDFDDDLCEYLNLAIVHEIECFGDIVGYLDTREVTP